MALTEDQFYQLKSGIRSLISGVTLNGNVVKVYDSFVPAGIDHDAYILVSGNSSLDTNQKSIVLTQATMQLSIFVKGDTLRGTEHYDIGGQVISRIIPRNGYKIMDVANFNILQAKFVSDIPIVGGGDTTEKVLERNILVEFYVQHLLRNRL